MATTYRNPYEVLGVSRASSQDDIKAAYRKLALQYHPDRNPGDTSAENRFKEISEAYATLRDPAQRARFDQVGHTQSQAGRPDFSTVDWQTVFNEADINIDFSKHQNMPKTGNAVFDTLFGALNNYMRESGLLPGEDREVTLRLSWQEARSGSKKTVKIPGPSVCARCQGSGQDNGLCENCRGRGFVRAGDLVTVTVPQGVANGGKLRLRGQGGPGTPPGDAYVQIEVMMPLNYEALGKDVFGKLDLTPLEASRGGVFIRHGLSITVPPEVQQGQRLKVSQGGLAGGDAYFRVSIGVWRGVLRKVRDAVKGILPAA